MLAYLYILPRPPLPIYNLFRLPSNSADLP